MKNVRFDEGQRLPWTGSNEGKRCEVVGVLLKTFREAGLVRRVQRVLVTAALHHGVATAADVAAIGDLPPGAEARLVTEAVSELVELGVLEPFGGRESWGLVDWVAGQAWLDSHPTLGELRTAGGMCLDLEKLNSEF